MSFTTIREAARAYAKVDSNVVSQSAAGDEAKAVVNASRTYSVDRPRKLTASITSTGDTEYALTGVDSGWNGDYQVTRISQTAENQYDRVPLDDNDWEVFQHADEGFYLRFNGDGGAPGTGEILLVEYNAPHSLTEAGDDTISTDHPNDVDAVAHLAASYILTMAASKYAEQFDSTSSADAVARPASPNYTSLAKEQRAEYDAHMSKKPRVNSARVDWDSSMTGGGDRLFHRRRWF